jgi:hypothetical protein
MSNKNNDTRGRNGVEFRDPFATQREHSVLFLAGKRNSRFCLMGFQLLIVGVFLLCTAACGSLLDNISAQTEETLNGQGDWIVKRGKLQIVSALESAQDRPATTPLHSFSAAIELPHSPHETCDAIVGNCGVHALSRTFLFTSHSWESCCVANAIFYIFYILFFIHFIFLFSSTPITQLVHHAQFSKDDFKKLFFCFCFAFFWFTHAHFTFADKLEISTPLSSNEAIIILTETPTDKYLLFAPFIHSRVYGPDFEFKSPMIFSR